MRWEEADDPALVEGIRTRQAGAAEAFDARFRRRLLAIGSTWRLDQHEVEDAVQDTLLAAITQLQDGRFEGRSSVARWVGQIFHNRLIDLRRRDGRRRELIAIGETGEQESLAGPAQEPTGLQETRLLVREALMSLPRRDRLMLLMNVLGGLPVREIAVLMRLGQKNAEAIVTGAKRRFREFLRDVD
jgi:RNA polymerase sigma factor (sigma-70 family)